MEEEARRLGDGPTGLLFLPYLSGERAPVWDPHARGAICGLSLGTTRADLIKAVMEGVAFGLRQNVEVAERAGFRVAELHSCGGGARSPLWCQIKADVTGRSIFVYPEWRDASYGAALLAGVAAGFWTEEELVGPFPDEATEVYRPRPEITRRYLPLYENYRQLYPRLKGPL